MKIEIVELNVETFRLTVFDDDGSISDIMEAQPRIIMQWAVDVMLPHSKLRIRKP